MPFRTLEIDNHANVYGTDLLLHQFNSDTNSSVNLDETRSTTTSLMDPDNIAQLIEERNAQIEILQAAQKQEMYKKELIKAFRQYEKFFIRLFKIHCLNEAKNFIISMPREQCPNINCVVEDANKQYLLDIAKINSILQDRSNNIIIDYVISLAIKLNVGHIKATYTGERIQTAEYWDQKIGSFWKIKLCEHPAWARYLVNIAYVLPEKNIMLSLISLEFAHQLPINMPLGDALKAVWPNSSLVSKSIFTYPNDFLSNMIDEVVKHAIYDTSPAAKCFRRELLTRNQDFYNTKFNQANAQYKFILSCAQGLGVSPEIIAQIGDPLNKTKFIEDFVNLSLAEHSPDGSITLFTKCSNMVFSFRKQIEELVYQVPAVTEDSSDEEPVIIEQQLSRLCLR